MNVRNAGSTSVKLNWKWYLKDLPTVEKNGLNVFSCFSCGGGSSMGYKLAGYTVLGNCEIDHAMNKVYVANHHPKYNYNMDVREFGAIENEKLPEELLHLDILDGSPPCFAAGTLVKTAEGYKPIEEVQVGDMVFTHMGRFREVMAVMSHSADNVCSVSVAGLPQTQIILCTENHPFYTTDKLSGSEAVWKPACELDIERDVLHWWNGYGWEWRPIKEVKKGKEAPQQVYNLSVKEDESYTVFNIAVHNCSVFSSAGEREKGWNTEKQFREGQKLQRLDDLFFWFIDIAKKLQPKVVIAENVKGLTAGNAKGYVNEIFKAFRAAGYKPQMFLMNGASMGVPQRRERVFFVAQRNDLNFPKLQLSFHEKPILFGEVRSEKGVPLKEGSRLKMLLDSRKPTDRKLADINERLSGKYKGFTNYIWSDDQVCGTIASGGSYFRMYDGMGMSKQDFINVQTFPQDYDFIDQQPQYVCGMSVPPVMMARIAHEVERQWLRPGDRDGSN